MVQEGVGSIPNRGNEMFNIFISSIWCRGALNCVIYHAIPPEFGRKWRTEGVYTTFPVPTLLLYRIQCEADL